MFLDANTKTPALSAKSGELAGQCCISTIMACRAGAAVLDGHDELDGLQGDQEILDEGTIAMAYAASSTSPACGGYQDACWHGRTNCDMT